MGNGMDKKKTGLVLRAVLVFALVAAVIPVRLEAARKDPAKPIASVKGYAKKNGKAVRPYIRSAKKHKKVHRSPTKRMGRAHGH